MESIEFIEKALKGTRRTGATALIKYMKENGFYEAPASTEHHGSEPGALAVHSINVFNAAHALAKTWLSKEDYKKLKNSITICSLLHDIGKIGDFGKKNYVENILKLGKQSDKKPFVTNKDLLYEDHEIRSVKICAKFIELTEEEEHAILYHNGLYGSLKYSIQGKETPLYMIIHFADMWASRVLEAKGEEDEI